MDYDQGLEMRISQEARSNPHSQIAYAILRLAEAQRDTAIWLKYLGNGDAATTMGALEAFGKFQSESLERLAHAIDGIAEAIDQARSDGITVSIDKADG